MSFEASVWVLVAMIASVFVGGIIAGWVRDYIEHRRVKRIMSERLPGTGGGSK